MKDACRPGILEIITCRRPVQGAAQPLWSPGRSRITGTISHCLVWPSETDIMHQQTFEIFIRAFSVNRSCLSGVEYATHTEQGDQ